MRRSAALKLLGREQSLEGAVSWKILRHVVKERRTEDELFRRRQHVQGESDFILVVLLLQPFHQTSGLKEEESGQERDNRNAGSVSRR